MSTLKVDTLQHRDGTEYILSERNKLINGDFSVAQRGTSLTSTDSANNDAKYTLDRWQLFSDGNDIVDVTQETTTVPTNQLYAIALDVETANKKFGIAQKIEQKNCVDLIGQEVTLSFKAKVSSTTNLDNVKCAIIAWDGTADTLTDDIVSAWGSEGTDPTLATNYTYENTPANLNLTTSYATYTTTATIDTSGAKNVVVFIWSDVTTTSAGEFLYVTDVQLEKSPSNTPFERKSYGRQLADCERYYWKWQTVASETFGKGLWFNGDNYIDTHLKFPTTMRSIPTVSTNSGTNYFSITHGASSTIYLTDLSPRLPSRYSVELFANSSDGATGGSTNRADTIRSNSASAYIQGDAEL